MVRGLRNVATLAPVLGALTRDGLLSADLLAQVYAIFLKHDPSLNPGVVLNDVAATVVHRIEGLSEPSRPMAPRPWTTTDPSAAMELLRDDPRAPLWPWEPGGAAAPQWWDGRWQCEACYEDYGGGGRSCAECDEANLRDAPVSLPALVSVASLGAATLLRAAMLIDVVDPGKRIVWRSLTGAEAAAHHNNVLDTGTSNDPLVLLSTYASQFGPDDAEVERHREEGDPRGADVVCALVERGVFIVACGPERVVLGVEAVS